MVKKIISIISLTAAVICGASQGYAQVTTGNLDQSADQGQGQYQPMNMGYAGFNSLGMTQAAWLDPLQNLGEVRPSRLIPSITGLRIWFCRSAFAKA